MAQSERTPPQRTCLGCGTRDDQQRLLRLAVTDQGRLVVDRDRGRGGYLHRDAVCWRKFLGRKALHRAFRVEVSRAAKEQFIEDIKGQDRE